MPPGLPVLDERAHGGVPTLTEVLELKPPQGLLPGAGPEVVDDGLAGPATAEPTAEPAQASPASALDAVAEEAPLVTPLPACAAQDDGGPAAPPPAAATMDADALVAQVLAELAPRIDLMFEARLREALAPALAQAADALIRDTRGGLSATLRELVQEAVARALRRRAGH
jgi:hypothetical protein